MSEAKKYPWGRYTVSLDEKIHNETVGYLHSEKPKRTLSGFYNDCNTDYVIKKRKEKKNVSSRP